MFLIVCPICFQVHALVINIYIGESYHSYRCCNILGIKASWPEMNPQTMIANFAAVLIECCLLVYAPNHSWTQPINYGQYFFFLYCIHMLVYGIHMYIIYMCSICILVCTRTHVLLRAYSTSYVGMCGCWLKVCCASTVISFLLADQSMCIILDTIC